MLHHLQNPIIFAIAMGTFVAAYMWFEDSLTDKGIASKTKYIRAFILVAVGVNVIQTYANKASPSSTMGGNMISHSPYQQSYGVGTAPF